MWIAILPLYLALSLPFSFILHRIYQNITPLPMLYKVNYDKNMSSDIDSINSVITIINSYAYFMRVMNIKLGPIWKQEG